MTKPNEEFIDEFKRISSEKILREYEEKNRARIAESPFEIKGTFDDLWIKITGNSYYQPATTIKPVVAYGVNNTERSDPKSRKYMALKTFDTVYWQMIKRKIGKNVVDLYILDGDTDGKKRPIFQNLTADRLKELLGQDSAALILKTSKGVTTGSIKGPIDIKVEGYWEVEFAPASQTSDPIDVKLTWEGQSLLIKRRMPVILPGFYIENADNSTRDNFIQTPEQGRKKVGVIQTYPYSVLREATREEYLEQKASGDRAFREKIRRDDQI